MKSESMVVDAIRNEIGIADQLMEQGSIQDAFRHLDRAHVLGQSSTFEHTRVHWRMLKLGIKLGSVRETWGQIVRIIGAATKTPLGIYPKGNTGGANVWFFKPMPLPEDLKLILEEDGRDCR